MRSELPRIYELRKALFVYEMNRVKEKTKPETMDRLERELVLAADVFVTENAYLAPVDDDEES